MKNKLNNSKSKRDLPGVPYSSAMFFLSFFYYLIEKILGVGILTYPIVLFGLAGTVFMIIEWVHYNKSKQFSPIYEKVKNTKGDL